MDPQPEPATPPSPVPTPDEGAPSTPAYTALVGDWPTKATDAVDTLVALLRDKTVRPATLAARAIIFGIIIFAAAVTVVTLLSITLIRLLTVYVFDGRVWASDLLVGVLFVVVGLLAWSQRNTAPVEAPQ
jgi:hypothetical protein